MDVLDTTVFGNTLWSWLIAGTVFFLTLFALLFVKRIGGKRLSKLAARTSMRLDDVVASLITRTSGLFLFLLSLYAATLVLQLPEQLQDIAQSVAVIALLVQAGLWAVVLLTYWLEQYRERVFHEDPAAVTSLNAIGFIGKLVLWSIVLLLALDNLGIDVTALIAGLGVGGIAVALAVQNILGDLFASLSIIIDKPFVVGDFLIIGDCMGSVEHVGLKTTRLRSLSGEQLIFANSDLLASRIRNYGRMYERRVVFTIGVTYQTPRSNLKQIPAILSAAIESQENTRFDRAHFKAFGNFSLDFETVYYVLVPDYTTYMDIQQAINFRIHERFEQEGIEFAYPTQTLFVQSEG